MSAPKESFLALLERLEKECKPTIDAPAKPKGKQPVAPAAENPPSEIPFHLVEVGGAHAVDVVATHPIPSANYFPPTRIVR